MAHKKRNRIIALILLMVFSLNTIVGFACSIGIDMGYNNKHHAHATHAENGPALSHSAHHSHHQHEHLSASNINIPKEDCCAGEVTGFATLDKSIADNNVIIKAPLIFIVAFHNLFHISKNNFSVTKSTRFQFVRRSCFLNNTDIIIAIQSFLI
ncbi:hypothetical protein A4D02_24930 [Niastella koreensis]|uniref:Uncharacterized protein n=2 Tax=Niastella koreensis TaxID=354356 RepID=G8TFX7_NIAKG|nr:hypothetical protein [Niastella koreensis]AEW00576.1 hypothetical protein Niako_4312 [Niastella koreensis GR20-10]OQP52434.1 hypothetical protein A4D02_24930 [Niastella koreensis]